MTDFKAKMHQIGGFAPDPAGGAYSAPPDETPRRIWGPLRGRGWAGEQDRKVRGGRGREKWRGGKGKAPS